MGEDRLVPWAFFQESQKTMDKVKKWKACAWGGLLFACVPFVNLIVFIVSPIAAIRLCFMKDKTARIGGIVCLTIWTVLWATMMFFGLIVSCREEGRRIWFDFLR